MRLALGGVSEGAACWHTSPWTYGTRLMSDQAGAPHSHYEAPRHCRPACHRCRRLLVYLEHVTYRRDTCGEHRFVLSLRLDVVHPQRNDK